jgi:hypothetical protein
VHFQKPNVSDVSIFSLKGSSELTRTPLEDGEVVIRRPALSVPFWTSTNVEMVIQARVTRDDGAERLTSHPQRNNIMNATRYLPVAGRLLIGLPFAMSGLSKLAAYGPTTEMIGAVGLPAPSLAFAVAVVVELGGGLLLIGRLPGSPRRDRVSSFLLGDCSVVSQQLRRPESDDPLP